MVKEIEIVSIIISQKKSNAKCNKGSLCLVVVIETNTHILLVRYGVYNVQQRETVNTILSSTRNNVSDAQCKQPDSVIEGL